MKFLLYKIIIYLFCILFVYFCLCTLYFLNFLHKYLKRCMCYCYSKLGTTPKSFFPLLNNRLCAVECNMLMTDSLQVMIKISICWFGPTKKQTSFNVVLTIHRRRIDLEPGTCSEKATTNTFFKWTFAKTEKLLRNWQIK